VTQKAKAMIADRYRRVGFIDGGGMGELLECFDTHLERRVILKRLQSGVEDRRLIDEYRALTSLRSKHVVQMFDLVNFAEGGNTYKAIVLEYIEGQDLAPATFEPNNDFLRVLWQIACGMKEIHAAGVIHRDIKPNNIRMDQEGIIKIIDFGLARTNSESKTRSIIGTPVFMAPELWGDETISFNRAIDIYAFGVTFISLLSANLPQSLAARPPAGIDQSAIERIAGGIPSDIISTFHSCLSVVPTKRPDASEIANVIERHLLFDRHRALVVMNGNQNWLDQNNRRISLTAGQVGKLTIEYDGFSFKVSLAQGSVFVNNTPATVGLDMPGCCVLTFGTGGSRSFVTFDVSHPEVMA
jgi:serine/threonine protein kinase